jgi:hypothetical protein
MEKKMEKIKDKGTPKLVTFNSCTRMSFGALAADRRHAELLAAGGGNILFLFIGGGGGH